MVVFEGFKLLIFFTGESETIPFHPFVFIFLAKVRLP